MACPHALLDAVDTLFQLKDKAAEESRNRWIELRGQQDRPRRLPDCDAVARQMLAWFASLKLAVMLLVGLAAVLAAATLLESAKGREYAQWYVYKNPWFMALVGLLALNILAATIVRFPWRRGHRGFLLAHAGVLVLLAGAMLSFVAGVEGQLSLEEGQSGDTLVMADRNQLTTVWAQHDKAAPLAIDLRARTDGLAGTHHPAIGRRWRRETGGAEVSTAMPAPKNNGSRIPPLPAARPSKWR